MSYNVLDEIEAKYKYHARENNGRLPNLCLIPFEKLGDFINQAEERQGYELDRSAPVLSWHGMFVMGCEIQGCSEIIVVYKH